MPPVTRKRLKEVADGDCKEGGDASESKKMIANAESPVQGEESIKMRTRRQSLLVHRGKENMTTPLKGDSTGESDVEGKTQSRNRLATPQKKVHNSCGRSSTVSLVKAMSDCELSPAKRKLRRYSMFSVDEKNEDSDTEDQIPVKKLSSCRDMDKKTDCISSQIHSGIDNRNPSQSTIAEEEEEEESSVSVKIVSGKDCTSEKLTHTTSALSPVCDEENENFKPLEQTAKGNGGKVHVLDRILLQCQGADEININVQSESSKEQVGNERSSTTTNILNPLSVDEKRDEDNNKEMSNTRLINPPLGKIIAGNELSANVQIEPVAEQIQDEKSVNTTSILNSDCVEEETVEVNNIYKIHTSVIKRSHCEIVENETSVNGQIESVTEQMQDEKLVNTTSILNTCSTEEEKQYKLFEHKDNTQKISTSIIIPQHCEMVAEDKHSMGVEIELGQEQVQNEKLALTTLNLNPISIEGDVGKNIEMIDTTQITEKKEKVVYERDDDIYDPNFKLIIESSPELNRQEDDMTLVSENRNNVKVDPNTEISVDKMSGNKECVVEERSDLFSEDKDEIGEDGGTYLGKLLQDDSDEDSGVEASLPPCGQICSENNCSSAQIDGHNRDNIHFKNTSIDNSDICNGNQERDSEFEELYPPSVQLAEQNIGVSDNQSVKNDDNLGSCSKVEDEDSGGDIFCFGNSDFENIGENYKSNLEGDKNIKDFVSPDEQKVENVIFYDSTGRSDNGREYRDNSNRHNDGKECVVDTNINSDLESEDDKFDDLKAKCNGIFSDEISEEEGQDKSDEEGSARFSEEDNEDDGEEEEDYCEVPRRKERVCQFLDFEAEEGEESDYEEEEEAEEEEESESDDDSGEDILEEDPKKLAKMFLNDEAEDEDELKRRKRKRILIIESDDESGEEDNSSEKRFITDSCINKTVSCERSMPEEMFSMETSVNENISSESSEEMEDEAMTIENDGVQNVRDYRREICQEAGDKVYGKEVSISEAVLSNTMDEEAHTHLQIPISSSDEKSFDKIDATLKSTLQITSSKKIMDETNEIHVDKPEFERKVVNQDINSKEETNKPETQEQHPKVKSNVLEYNLIQNGNEVKKPAKKITTKMFKMSPRLVQKNELVRRNIEKGAKIWNVKEVKNAASIRRQFIEAKDRAARVGQVEQTWDNWNVTESKVIKVDGWTVQERKMSQEKLKRHIAYDWFITHSVCDRDGPWVVRDNVHSGSNGIYKILVKNFPLDWRGNVKRLLQINSGNVSVQRFGRTCFLLSTLSKSIMQNILFSKPCIVKNESNSWLLTCETYPIWTVYVSGVPLSLSQERVKRDLLSIMDEGDVYDVCIPKNSLDNRIIGHAILKVVNKETRNRILNSHQVTLWGKVLTLYNENKFLKKFVLKISNWNFSQSRCDAIIELKNLIRSWGVKKFLVVSIGNFIGLKFFQESYTKTVLQKSNACIFGEVIYFTTWDYENYECQVETLII